MMPTGVRASLAAVLPAGLLLLTAVGVHACDTPVYAYTMQMWAPDAYHVFYFHDGAEDPADRDVNRFLAEAAQDPDGKTNLRFESVDVSSPPTSGVVATIWKRNQSRKLPLHVVVSPRGLDIAGERLTVSGAKAMLHSPKRDKLAELLCEGKHGVMLLLLGANADENATAQATVKAAAEEAAKSGADVGVLEIRRNDAAEKWFVRQMLAVEDDLNDLNNTMLFGVFGRGHIIEPFVGRGISHDNMLELAAFMGGPCSCEVKETAPGTDLLMTYNWDQASVEWTAAQGYAEIPYMEVPAAPADEAAAATPVDAPAAKPAKPAQPAAKPGKPAPPAAATKPPAPPVKPEPPARKTDAPAAERSRPPRAQQTKGRDGPRDRGPQLPPPDVAAAASPNVAAGRMAETQAAALDEVARGPSLPNPAAAAAAIQTRPPFASRLSAPLAIAVGVLTFGVVLGGLALVWVRREQA
jgi:hypothetical protein